MVAMEVTWLSYSVTFIKAAENAIGSVFETSKFVKYLAIITQSNITLKGTVSVSESKYLAYMHHVM